MLKPERLILELNAQYKKYLTLVDPGEITDTQASLVKAMKRFLATNLVYWTSINIEELSGTVLITSAGDQYFLADFFTPTNEHYSVPIRRVYNGHNTYYFMVPSLFLEGTYQIGGHTFKSTGISVTFESKLDTLSTQYIELIRGNEYDNIAIQEVYDIMDRRVDLMIPINPSHGIYSVVGSARNYILDKVMIISRVKFYPNAEAKELAFGQREYGYKRLGGSLNCIMADIRNAYTLHHRTNDIVKDKSFAYASGHRYYHVKESRKPQLYELTLMTKKDLELVADDSPFHYLVDDRLELAK